MSVAIVVLMAVPVMALINDSSDKAGEGIVVSIRDADSFGGAGFDPREGGAPGDFEDEESFSPGANMGVGFPTNSQGEIIEPGSESGSGGTRTASSGGTGPSQGGSFGGGSKGAVTPVNIEKPRFYADGLSSPRTGSSSSGTQVVSRSTFDTPTRTNNRPAATSGSTGSAVAEALEKAPLPKTKRNIASTTQRQQSEPNFEFLSRHCVDYLAAQEAALDDLAEVPNVEPLINEAPDPRWLVVMSGR